MENSLLDPLGFPTSFTFGPYYFWILSPNW